MITAKEAQGLYNTRDLDPALWSRITDAAIAGDLYITFEVSIWRVNEYKVELARLGYVVTDAWSDELPDSLERLQIAW